MAGRVAITGAAGLIGSVLRDGLGGRYDLRLLDRRLRSGRLRRRGDSRRLSRLVGSFAGCDAVVDLAGDASPDASWGRVLGNNLPAATNAFEAARRAGVERVVYASSSRVTGLYERDEPYASLVAGRYGGLEAGSIPLLSSRSALRPDSPYAAGKAFGEAVARYYADEFGISCICLRIGTVNPPSRPLSPRHFSTLLTHRDLVRLVECSLEAPSELGFLVVYGVSGNTWRFWDLDEARDVLGYEPLDDAEQWRDAGAGG